MFLKGTLTLCSSESAKLVFSGNAQLVFCRESSACFLRECSICVLHGMLSLCSARISQLVFILKRSASNLHKCFHMEIQLNCLNAQLVHFPTG